MKTFDLGAVTAYALAVKNGFEGTVEEWLDSLVPKISVGTVETGEPDSDVVVTMDGNAKTPVLNFRIPRGKSGAVTTVNGVSPDENGNVQVETSSQSDWNAAEGEPGHVLNRTHYTYKMFEDFTFNMEIAMSGGYETATDGSSMFLFKVSDYALTDDDLNTMGVKFGDSEPTYGAFTPVDVGATSDQGAMYMFGFQTFAIASIRMAGVIAGLEIPSTGTYFMPLTELNGDITIVSPENIVPLEEKFLPKTAATQKYVQDYVKKQLPTKAIATEQYVQEYVTETLPSTAIATETYVQDHVTEKLNESNTAMQQYVNDRQPNWSAKEGELGHVLNRTHYVEDIKYSEILWDGNTDGLSYVDIGDKRFYLISPKVYSNSSIENMKKYATMDIGDVFDKKVLSDDDYERLALKGLIGEWHWFFFDENCFVSHKDDTSMTIMGERVTVEEGIYATADSRLTRLRLGYSNSEKQLADYFIPSKVKRHGYVVASHLDDQGRGLVHLSVLTDGTRWNFGIIKEIIISASHQILNPNAMNPLQRFEIHFQSDAEPTIITKATDIVMRYEGTDCEGYIFTPVANKVYVLDFRAILGSIIYCHVIGIPI